MEIPWSRLAVGLRLMVVGALVMVVDVAVDGVDLVPDLLGALLIGAGSIVALPATRRLDRLGVAAGYALVGLSALGVLVELPGAGWLPGPVILVRELLELLGVALAVVGWKACLQAAPHLTPRWTHLLLAQLLLLTLDAVRTQFVAGAAGWNRDAGVAVAFGTAPMAIGLAVVAVAVHILLLVHGWRTAAALRRAGRPAG